MKKLNKVQTSIALDVMMTIVVVTFYALVVIFIC